MGFTATLLSPAGKFRPSRSISAPAFFGLVKRQFMHVKMAVWCQAPRNSQHDNARTTKAAGVSWSLRPKALLKSLCQTKLDTAAPPDVAFSADEAVLAALSGFVVRALATFAFPQNLQLETGQANAT